MCDRPSDVLRGVHGIEREDDVERLAPALGGRVARDVEDAKPKMIERLGRRPRPGAIDEPAADIREQILDVPSGERRGHLPRQEAVAAADLQNPERGSLRPVGQLLQYRPDDRAVLPMTRMLGHGPNGALEQLRAATGIEDSERVDTSTQPLVIVRSRVREELDQRRQPRVTDRGPAPELGARRRRRAHDDHLVARIRREAVLDEHLHEEIDKAVVVRQHTEPPREVAREEPCARPEVDAHGAEVLADVADRDLVEERRKVPSLGERRRRAACLPQSIRRGNRPRVHERVERGAGRLVGDLDRDPIVVLGRHRGRFVSRYRCSARENQLRAGRVVEMSRERESHAAQAAGDEIHAAAAQRRRLRHMRQPSERRHPAMPPAVRDHRLRIVRRTFGEEARQPISADARGFDVHAAALQRRVFLRQHADRAQHQRLLRADQLLPRDRLHPVAHHGEPGARPGLSERVAEGHDAAVGAGSRCGSIVVRRAGHIPQVYDVVGPRVLEQPRDVLDVRGDEADNRTGRGHSIGKRRADAGPVGDDQPSPRDRRRRQLRRSSPRRLIQQVVSRSRRRGCRRGGKRRRVDPVALALEGIRGQHDALARFPGEVRVPVDVLARDPSPGDRVGLVARANSRTRVAHGGAAHRQGATAHGERVGHVRQRQRLVADGGGDSGFERAQRRRRVRGQREHLPPARRSGGCAGRGLLEHDVRVGAADAERAHPRAARAVRGPRFGSGRHAERAVSRVPAPGSARVKCTVGGIVWRCSASTVLISPATPAAMSRWPTLPFTEPSAQQP